MICICVAQPAPKGLVSGTAGRLYEYSERLHGSSDQPLLSDTLHRTSGNAVGLGSWSQMLTSAFAYLSLSCSPQLHSCSLKHLAHKRQLKSRLVLPHEP